MAPYKNTHSNQNSANSYSKSLQNWCQSTTKLGLTLLTDQTKLPIIGGLYLIAELLINVAVIEMVPYTEIDWKAYMQEVEGVINGTYDYNQLKGDTGPLVYPAGFVYVFSLFYYLTSHGTNIRLAQYIFAALHILLLILIFRIYAKTKKVPPYALILVCCTSYRIHSIFVLRLFNDPIAMLFLYGSINAFLDSKWYLGSFLYSLAVSIKMNILLFSPALLIAYLTNLGPLKTALQLSVCAIVQIILALPFLMTDTYAYIKGAFNLGRVFFIEWTVNWRFLPESVFIDRYFHVSLLAVHILTLLYFSRHWTLYLKSYAKLKYIETDLRIKLKKNESVDMSTSAQLFVLPLFACNFIGIMFSRSLHYQFYIWYYHTLPYIVWHANFKTVTRFAILGIIEMCWNTFPSTCFSSFTLHLCHIALLYGLFKHKTNTEKSLLN